MALNRISQLYQDSTGNFFRALKIEDIRSVTVDGKNERNFYLLTLEFRNTMYVTTDWYVDQQPVIGGYFLFDSAYKTTPVDCVRCKFLSEEIFKQSAFKKAKSVKKDTRTSVKSTNPNKPTTAPVLASAYESAIIQAENRIIDLVAAWDEDDGTNYPEELPAFLDRLRRRELQ